MVCHPLTSEHFYMILGVNENQLHKLVQPPSVHKCPLCFMTLKLHHSIFHTDWSGRLNFTKHTGRTLTQAKETFFFFCT